MKELSIEEKAKAYDKVIIKARRYYDEYKTRDNILYVEDMEDMFPELKESEDEKIIKEMKAFFSLIRLGQVNFLREDYDWNAYLAFLESLKDRIQPQPNQEWSEEDEDIINKILCICDDFKRSFEISPASTKVVQNDIDKIDSWLKSLKERYTWKPSEHELEVLKLAAEKAGTCLMGLYKQLKKLKEE